MADFMTSRTWDLKTPLKLDHYHQHYRAPSAPDGTLVSRMGESSSSEQKSKMNLCSTSTAAATKRTPIERSTSSSTVEALCRQSDNYCGQNYEKSAAKATFSLIMSALRGHFLNSSDSNMIDSNCCQTTSHVGMTLNLPTIAASKSSRLILSSKTKARSPVVPLQKVRYTSDATGTRRESAAPEATTTITANTELTGEENDKNASDHHPNNVVECRIPLVNANNEYSRLATEAAASRLKVTDMVASSSSLSLPPRKTRCNDTNRRENRSVIAMGGKSVWWQLVVAVYSLLLYISATSVCWAARQEVASNCTFPSRWEGTWFLSGYQQSVHIRGSQFSYRGKCAASDGNKYLIVNDECHRCLVIYEKHKNVLQFKESFCKRRETLQNLCDQIPGDALLYSLFRENAEPVKCPLNGPFSFTYNRGHGECKSPVSNIESCTEDSRLLLSFQACPDVQGTESTVEELTCLATWKDGNSRYLIGLVSQHHTHHLQAPHHALSNEERYRCFVYEKISTLMGPMSNLNVKDAEYKLAQSGDATCNGLDSAEVGSRIMTLRKPPPAERCDFPAWFKAPRHWRALMGNIVYTFHQSDGSIHIKSNGLLETWALCEQINKQTQTEMMAVVHYTSQCESGFMCMTFYKRDMQVAEIQMGTPASRLEDACAPDHFDINKLPFVTLLASSPESQICPLEGLFSLRGAIGPPYITSRHKRNHNNKGHNQHGHHHHEQGHKRHGIQSFRNSEEFGQTSWQSHTRGLSIRSRRAATNPTISSQTRSVVISGYDLIDSSSVADSVPYKSKVLVPNHRSNRISMEGSETFHKGTGNNDDDGADEENILDITNEKTIEMPPNVDGGLSASSQQRNRRDVPACIVNYKAQRQLLVGCTDPNLIEVRPRCSEDGEESYLCHGSWTENSTVYIVAKNQATQHGVCISYKQLDGNDGLLVVGDSCYRGLQKPPDHHFVANLTLAGKCGDTNSAHSIRRYHSKQNWILLAISTTTTLMGITVSSAMLVNFSAR
ncbi:uncharacterized protein LOC119652536 isoform X4 [Hermetia illucens]|uniref:uncharacterized protein LOC119652536 isoform X4 n=1 Tax=Hermetia illucens TaxID=343691 RepID=UPI0018CBFC19|nr:uncharacterized protein LOC119652536 isoform X4 [Hermetia illucens]